LNYFIDNPVNLLFSFWKLPQRQVIAPLSDGSSALSRIESFEPAPVRN